MFIGHFAIGFASKRLAPRASLGVLMAGVLWLDLLWPLFLLAGWERVEIAPNDTAFAPLRFVSYPISHSLLTTAGWAAGFALVYYFLAHDRRGAWVVAGCVASHWFLDAATHRPDLPLYPGGPVAGLGLWHSVTGTILVESALFLAGVWLYARATIATNRTGRIAFWALVLFLVAAYAGNAQGSPPPNPRFLAYFALSLWIFPFWAWWVDRHRRLQS